MYKKEERKLKMIWKNKICKITLRKKEGTKERVNIFDSSEYDENDKAHSSTKLNAHQVE